MSRIDYSVWDRIEVSDDEDDTRTDVDTPQHQKKGEELNKGLCDVRRELADAQKKIKELSSSRADDAKEELSKVQAEEKKLKEEEQDWENKVDDHNREEKKMPRSNDGVMKSAVKVKPEDEETEEEKAQRQKTFVEKYEKEMKHFGMLRLLDDSQKYLSENPHLVCEETANYLASLCVELEVEKNQVLMEQVGHQTTLMHFILEMAKCLQVDPRGCFHQFFTNIMTASRQNQDASNEESFKERFRGSVMIRIEKAMKEYVEEERQKRLGPGGLDPVDVYESLPAEMQKCVDEEDMQMLHQVMSKIEPTEAKVHVKRFIDSGLWVPKPKMRK